jgi:hypothetical protein
MMPEKTEQSQALYDMRQQRATRNVKLLISGPQVQALLRPPRDIRYLASGLSDFGVLRRRQAFLALGTHAKPPFLRGDHSRPSFAFKSSRFVPNRRWV